MPELKLVADYANTSIDAVLEYPIDRYKAILRAAIINNLKQTKDGREYLQKAKRLSTTTIDDKQYEQFRRGDNNWLSI